MRLEEWRHQHLFLKRIKRYGSISKAAEKELLSKVSRVHYLKGHQVIREGQVATSFFLVESGMLRSFYRKGNREITTWLAYEGQIAASISSLFENKPSHETMECIEDCNLLCISNKDLQELYRQYECLNTIGWKLAEEYCSILEDRAYSLQVMSATERYKDLMEYDPEVIKRAPLSYIASFLGISQETLSRIRHNW